MAQKLTDKYVREAIHSGGKSADKCSDAVVSGFNLRMRTDLDHLPAAKQRGIERVKAIIFEEFEDALALAQHEWKKKGKIEKIILYGSYGAP